MTSQTSTYECGNAFFKPLAQVILATVNHGGKVHLAWDRPINGCQLLCGNPAPVGQTLAVLADDGDREEVFDKLLAAAVSADRLCRACFAIRTRTAYTALVHDLTRARR
ncbi:hypothetical protein GCM10010126_57810 [Planomonospora parontospora]|uniref:Uncharacterized protein n=2 Tax=Planomonospora parontospora TaxID=58119 RepID=A0AA37F7L0_9ACTN|nr:hypothetical protein [Planomonospora parontospora]GGK90809.1 hypothetical protein GCM10010126_57810 [Planomonospora parontospora]